MSTRPAPNRSTSGSPGPGDRYADQRQIGLVGSAGHRCFGGGRGTANLLGVDRLDDGKRRARCGREWSRFAGDAQRRQLIDHHRRWINRTLRPGRRRHRRDRADHDLDREHFGRDGPQRLRRQRGRRGIENQSRRDHGHDVGDERLWVLRQQRRDDLRAGRAEHNHVRKWLDRPLRLWRRVDHHRRRRVDRHSRRLGAGRAGRPRRACHAERRYGDDHGERLARRVRKRRRLAGDARRRKHPEHRGAGSIGLYALGGGVINATGPTTISTFGTTSTSTGLSAYGVDADGAGSQINLAAATVTTSGANAFGFYASSGGVIAAPDAPSVTTSGNGSIGLYASGAGSTIAATGASIVTTYGASAPAVQADTGGLVTLNARERAEHQRRRRSRTLRLGRRRHRRDRADHDLDREHFRPRRASAPSASTRTARDRKSILPQPRSRRRGRTPMDSTPTTAGRSPRRTRRA